MNETKSTGCACQGVGPAVTTMLGNMAPSAAREHFRAARLEFLKGIRSLVDWRIEHLSKPARAEETGTAVPID